MPDKDTFFTNAERSLITKLMLDRTPYRALEDKDKEIYSVHIGKYMQAARHCETTKNRKSENYRMVTDTTLRLSRKKKLGMHNRPHNSRKYRPTLIILSLSYSLKDGIRSTTSP